MTKHTPGPWKVGPPHWHRGTRGRDCKQPVYSSAGPVAEVFGAQVALDYPPGQERIDSPDARLIAAAPDLLETLRWLVNTSCDVGKDGNEPTMNEHIDAIEAGKAAIAKATGS